MSSYALFAQERSIMLSGTLQVAATNNGTGTPLDVDGYCTALLNIVGSIGGGTEIFFEGSIDGTDWVSTLATNMSTGDIASSTTALGLWTLNITGLSFVRARIASYSSGTITVDGVASVLAGPTSSAVTITSLPLPTNASQETGGNLDTIAGAISSGKMHVALDDIAGNTISTGNGTAGSGVQRVAISSDNTAFSVNATLQTGSNVIGALSSNQTVNVTQLAGTSIASGSGTINAGTIRTVPASDSTTTTNLSTVNATTVATGNGTASAGCQRVTVASDNSAFAVNATLQTGSNVIGSLVSNQSINVAQMSGNTIATGNGTASAACQRVAIASDNTAFAVNATLQSGSNTIGSLTANQTVNLNQVAGSSINTGNGTASGSPRVVIASDNTNVPVADSNLATAQNASASGVKGPLVQGVCASSAPTYTNGNIVPFSFTTAGALRVDSGGGGGGGNVNVTQINSTTPLMGNGSSGTGAQRITICDDSTGQLRIAPSTKSTYLVSTYSGQFTFATSATDVIVLKGNATTTLKLLSWKLWVTQSGFAYVTTMSLDKLEGATLSGSPAGTALDIAKLDSSSGSASSSANYFNNSSGNPSFSGATRRTIVRPIIHTGFGTSVYETAGPHVLFEATALLQPIALRGVNQFLTLNFNGTVPTSVAIASEIIWIEE